MAKAAQGEHVEFALIPVTAVKYTYTVIPALVMTWCLSYIERWVDSITPAVTQSFLKPMLIVLIAAPLAILLIGPIGISGSVAPFRRWFTPFMVIWAGFPVAIMERALWPLLVMTGMHRASLRQPSFRPLPKPAKRVWSCRRRSALTCRPGGSSLAVAWRKTKNPELRQTALAAAASAIMAGISEPALYGVAIRLKRPLIASLNQRFYLRRGCRYGGACQPLNGNAGAVYQRAVLPVSESNEHRLGVRGHGAGGGAVVLS
ncbi:PTS transporter subunit EIIC [Klebsiella pneumoniae]|nr:PTS transporter subunit EIIC [Klebsiella pneumoniae]